MQPDTPKGGLAGLPLHVLESVHAFLDRECILAVTDAAGIIVFANDSFCRITGYSRGELLGRSHRMLKSGVHSPEFYAGLWGAVSSGDVWRGELCNRAKDGSLYWVQSAIAPIRDASGAITHYFALRFDISEKKDAMRRLIEEERMATIGGVADGVAHDLKGFLTAAMLTLAESRSLEPPLRSVLAAALAGMDDLTTKMRDLAAARSSERKRVAIARVAEVTGRIAAFKPSSNLSLKLDCDFADLKDAYVLGNEGELCSAILNLVSNAIEAVERARPALVRMSGRVERGRVRLTVEDNGPGVSPELLPTLFAPLSSTKGPGRGRGLSMARKIAEDHGGSLVHAPAGRGGAAFHLTLPLA
jgi:PAS domain S-box-containing protein